MQVLDILFIMRNFEAKLVQLLLKACLCPGDSLQGGRR